MTDTSSPIRPVSRATLPQEIVKAITDLIMRRVWKPGDMIPSEKELAIQFHVGRSTVREAIKSLAVLGVLDARAGEGSFIRAPNSELLSGAFRWGLMLSERNLDDLIDVRALVEVECARRAAERRTEQTLDRLAAAIEEMKAHEGSADLFMAIDMKFHNAISQAAAEPDLRQHRFNDSGDGPHLVPEDLLHSGNEGPARSTSTSRSRPLLPLRIRTRRPRRCARI